jgi:Protein of unknown function (DUF3072)
MATTSNQARTDTVPDPDTWQTADEPATERQQAYVERLARDAGADAPRDLTKARASEVIEELREHAAN